MTDVIYLSHGGGPLPLLDKEGHKAMHDYYKTYAKDKHPRAIIIISAHYETDEFTVVTNHSDKLLFDYYGFPEISYTYTYNPPIDEEVNKEVLRALKESNIPVTESKRDLDHGVFIPLMIMFEEANIPVVQISLKRNLSPKDHIQLGEALGKIDDVLIIGSGSSYHNLRAYLDDSINEKKKNDEFHNELIKVVTNDIPEADREQRLIYWKRLPHALHIHPREEHLIPLHVCYGVKKSKGKVLFDNDIFNKRNICIEW